LGLSDAFGRHVAPLYGLLKAQDYLHIQTLLRRRAGEREKMVDMLRWEWAKPLAIFWLRRMLKTSTKSHYLSEGDLSFVNGLIDHLGEIKQIDSLTRISIQRSIEEIETECVRRAYRQYLQAAKIKGLTSVRLRLSRLQGALSAYLSGFDTLVDDDRRALLNGYPNARIEVRPCRPLDPQGIVSFALDLRRQIIMVREKSGEQEALSIKRLSPTEGHHLVNELQRTDTLIRLRGSGLSPSYAALYTPLTAPPVTQRWRFRTKESLIVGSY
jgi:hypothetical protein